MSVKGWPPAHLTPTTATERQHGSGDEAIDFVEMFCRVTKDSLGGRSGELIVMRPWQRELFRALLARKADGRFKHRQGLVGLPRKSGKSAVLSGMALWNLITGPQGGEVYAVASGKDQARIVFGAVRRMAEMDPELAGMLRLFRDAIEFTDTGSVMRVLAAEAPQLEGLNPSFVVYDELHTAPNRELWDVLALAGGARREPLQIAITTAGVRTDNTGRDSLCYSMYQYGKRVASGEVDDPAFFMAWWEPKGEVNDYRDPKVWQSANPGYGDLSDPEDFESAVLRTPEPEFKTKRLNMWVSSRVAWMPTGAWSRCDDSSRTVRPETKVVLALDGSYKNDSTVVLGCTVEEHPHLFVLGMWERDPNADESWRVDIQEVEETVRQACRTFNVKEVNCDPYRWARTIQLLEDEGLPMMEFPQSPNRMVPATQRLYEAVLNDGVTHDGDPRLARHIENAALKIDSRGARLSKEGEGRKIDAAVTAVMAFDRAATLATEPDPRPKRVYGFGY